MPSTNEDSIRVAVKGACAVVRVLGRGSYKCAPALRRFGLSVIDQGCRCLVLDMADCTAMDSTFMGVLAGLAMRMQDLADGGRLAAINLSAKTESLLDTLGLTRLMDTFQTGADTESIKADMLSGLSLDSLSIEDQDQRALVETMLTAHQNLSDLSAENRVRFKDVVAFLEQDLKQFEA